MYWFQHICLPYSIFMELFTLRQPPELLSTVLGKQFIYDHIFWAMCSHSCISRTFIWLETLINVYSTVCSFTSSLCWMLLLSLPRIMFAFSHTSTFLTHLQLVTHCVPHLLFWVATAWGVSPYLVFVQWILPALHAFILNFTLLQTASRLFGILTLFSKRLRRAFALFAIFKANTKQKNGTWPSTFSQNDKDQLTTALLSIVWTTLVWNTIWCPTSFVPSKYDFIQTAFLLIYKIVMGISIKNGAK